MTAMASRQPAPAPAPTPTSPKRAVGVLGAHKILIGVLVGVGLALGVSVPFALSYDARLDAQRSGYNDAASVVRMQNALTDGGQPPVALEARPGSSTRIGGETFTPSKGNTVVVVLADGGYCVQVTSEDSSVRRWTYDSLDSEKEYADEPGGACG